MGYDDKIIKFAKKYYDISYLDTEIKFYDIRKKYKSISYFKKAIFKLLKKSRSRYREDLLKDTENDIVSYLENNNNNDIILVINGDALTDYSYKIMRKYNPKAQFILYIWDDVEALFKKSHFVFFDSIFAYNLDDCKKYSFEYLPMFTEKLQVANTEIKLYDIAIIASANKKRIKTAKYLYNKYKNKWNFFIYFYSPEKNYDFFTYDKPLDYQSYLRILGESKVIFEMVRNNQKGPTTRFYDALETKTKVITTNKNISKYPIYGDNIYIMNNRKIIPEEFMIKEFHEENKKSLHIYTWFHSMISENNIGEDILGE